MSSVTRRRFPSMLLVCTLQGTEAEAERQLCIGTRLCCPSSAFSVIRFGVTAN
jgi:hypothetical protein